MYPGAALAGPYNEGHDNVLKRRCNVSLAMYPIAAFSRACNEGHDNVFKYVLLQRLQRRQ